MTINISRPNGSRQFIRFQGSIPTAVVGTAAFGSFISPFVAGVQTVYFLLGVAASYSQPVIPAGSTAFAGPADPRYALPNNVYDDTQNGALPPLAPDGTIAPHTIVASRTWAQNTVVVARALDANITLIVLAPIATGEWLIDTTAGMAGTGVTSTSTGLPVIAFDITAVATNANVDIQVEVKHSIGR